ncbi:Dipeptide transport system permease protein DppB [Microbacterium lemovicicum]|uniref:Dipeptide transport system permease protein DppB n=1 Tax=Microbacterium lemovicicum TaxID=1072463 RepID=A0A3Q9IWB6_9MICO|nr:ABC transporter permease [Microbacterium lemovicicum]AZS35786.1 Dipeptide transport system permease protein DppB [Microbacterium lemovicicum]
MGRYLASRVGQAVVVVWAAFTLAFVILYAMPSDPAEIIASGGLQGETGSEAGAQQLEQLRAEMGLDQPLVIQYVTRLVATASGNWGVSYQTGVPVTEMLAVALPPTIAIALLGLGIAVIVGMVLGFVATFTRFGPVRQLLYSLPSIGASVPTFWSALLLIQLFSFGLRLLPAFGNDGFASTILPAVALAIPISAMIAQVFGKSLRSVMAEPFLDTARAKGASRLRSMIGHAVRNALLPVLTIVGMIFGALLSGAVVIETVFGRQGFGRMTVEAVNAQDIPVVMGVVVFSALVFVVATLVVDLMYPLLDPRIRQGLRPARTLTAKAV